MVGGMEWNIIPLDSRQTALLAQALNLPFQVAQLLINRGLYSPIRPGIFFLRLC